MTIGEKQILARKGYYTQKGKLKVYQLCDRISRGRKREDPGNEVAGPFCSIAESQLFFVSNCLKCFQAERIMALVGLHLLILVVLELLHSVVGKLLLLIAFAY